MKKEYFNKIEFDRIINLSKTNLFDAVKMMERYIEIYSDDYSAQVMYASLLITIGEFEKAANIIDCIEKNYKIPIKYNDKTKTELLKKNLAFSKLRLLCYTEKYQEFLDTAKMDKKVLLDNNINIGAAIVFCCNKLGIDASSKAFENAYLYPQILEYSEESFREHIKKHLAMYEENFTKQTAIFNLDFPLDKILEEVKKYIPSNIRSYYGFFDNYYYFKYDDNGKCIKEKDRIHNKDGQSVRKTTDYFKVTTFNNTADLITICPCEGTKGFSYIDLNYLRKDEEKDKPKSIRKSRIDLFNERYSK